MDFDWDSANRPHLARHGVMPEEVEGLFQSATYELDSEDDEQDGRRFRLLGETDTGRILVVVVPWRGEALRIITAWDAPKAVRAFYLTRKAEDYGQEA